MKILFAFENALPSAEADAEVFTTTAKYLAPLTVESWLHVPLPDGATLDPAENLTIVRAKAPLKPGALRHFFCGLTLPFRTAFRQADLVYTRNLWIAGMSVLFGQRVVFDHYRPWPDQIPPLQLWIYRLFCNRRFLVNICHSEYTLAKYRALGIPADKLRCIHNGYEPKRFPAAIPIGQAKQKIGVPADRKTVVYTGRVNRKKGLDLVVEAAKALPDIQFILVGSYGEGPIEALAKDVGNIRIVPWQEPEQLADYVSAADIVLVPPSWQPLAKFGSTVLPLKLFFYLACGRPILAGETPDVMEVLRHGENAFLCKPDSVDALVGGVRAILGDPALASRLAATALDDSRNFTWSKRAEKIGDLIASRLESASTERGIWTDTQFRAWADKSRQWLVHLLRERSFILPPEVPLPPLLVPAEHD